MGVLVVVATVTVAVAVAVGGSDGDSGDDRYGGNYRSSMTFAMTYCDFGPVTVEHLP